MRYLNAVIGSLLASTAFAQQSVISTLAGGSPPLTPSPALEVSFMSPTGVAADAAGNVYFVSLNCVFELSQTGVLTRVVGNSRAGYSGDGGQATAAQLNNPRGIAFDAVGDLYIADVDNHRIRKVSPDGVINTVAGTGSAGFSGDGGQAIAARLSSPTGVALDAAGSIYIADSRNQRIRKISMNGAINTVAGTGVAGYSGDGGPAIGARLNIPNGVAADPAGNLYVVDTSNNRIRMVSVNGVITTLAGNGSGIYSGDGGAGIAAGISPIQAALDAAGNLYITDSGNLRVRKISTNGTITTVAGGGSTSGLGDGGLATSARLDYPYGVGVDAAGNVYVGTGNRLRRISLDGTINTLAGNGLGSYSGDGGPATAAQLNTPSSVAVDPSGNVYVADYNNNRVRKVSANGVISTFAGTGVGGYSGDGGPAAAAQIGAQWGVAADSAGNLYIADFSNLRVRKVSPDGMIRTVAGNGHYGSSGDGGLATSAELGGPSGVAVDGGGNLYIADYYQNRVRKVSPDGVIRTVAGNGTPGFSGDGGTATAAQLQQPIGLAVDAAGDLYIADTGNCRVRKVSASGAINTVAGDGTNSYSGDGGPAAAAWISAFAFGVAVDGSGNLYIADAGNNRIRKVTNGIITTVAGDGSPAYTGEGSPAGASRVSSPDGVAVDAAGNVYIADTGNNAVRVLRSAAQLTITTPSPLPQGAAGAAYSQTLNASGGVPPYTWAVTAGSLPGGLTLSTTGVISGAASAAGTFAFTVQVKDSAKSTSTATFSLTISLTASCTCSIDPPGLSIAAAGGTGSISVSAGAGCSWTASSSLSWVTIASGAAGTGNGTVTIQVSPNSASTSRSGAITVAGRTFQITQGGLGAASYLITTVAGGALPATVIAGTSVALTSLVGLATDKAGNVYFSCETMHVVFELSSSGMLTRVAGTGVPGFSGDGAAALGAALHNPQGLAIDTAGNLYIADVGNARVRKVSASGAITTVAGTGTLGFSGDGGPATSASLSYPFAVAVDASGNLYIADPGNSSVRKVTASTGVITTVAGAGWSGFSGDGVAAAGAALNDPNGIAVDRAGNLYISDSQNHRIRRVAVATGIIATVAGNGVFGYSGDGGPATDASLTNPFGVAVDVAGNVYIADWSSARIRMVAASNGAINTVAGSGVFGYSGDGGSATSAALAYPQGVAVDASGDLYFNSSGRVRKVASGGIISTVAGGGVGDGGLGLFTRLVLPASITRDSAGNLYVADEYDHRVRKIAATGVITTVAGNGTSGFSGDNGPATAAALHYPGSVTSDTAGNLYIADTGNARIRKVAAASGLITTVAGNGAITYSGDGGAATSASLNSPSAVAVDAAGNLYIAELYNGRVRKVAATTGVITTVAGNGNSSYSGDGGLATSASLFAPTSVAVDAAGNLYIGDSNNGRVRKVTYSNGVISTVAGDGSCSGLLCDPQAVAVDTAGDLYIADASFRRISKLPSSGGLTIIAGSGSSDPGDGGAAANASLSMPLGLTVDPAGNVYVVSLNGTVRLLTPTSSSAVLTVSPTHDGSFTAGENGAYAVTVANADGAGPTNGAVVVTEALPSGLSLVSMSGPGWTCNGLSCVRTDALGGGSSYPPITVVVKTSLTATAQMTNQVSVSGGGSPSTGAQDITTVAARPALNVTKTHSGNFIQGQSTATYAVIVSNSAGAAPSDGAVAVVETVPAGLKLMSMTGAGWMCSEAACTRNDALAPGASYPPIAVTVKVDADAPSPVVNTVSVSGAGSAPASASDSTVIKSAPPQLRISKTHINSFWQGQAGASYSITVGNGADGGPTSGPVAVAETIPAGMTLISMSGAGWTCTNAGATCTRTDTLAGGASYPPITVTVAVALNAPASLTNLVRVSGGGSADAAASDLSSILPPPVALRFVPIAPCRVADTRNAAGAFGGPLLAGGSTRDFVIPNSACGVRQTAQAYSLNVAVVPSGPLGFLTLWPAGQARPLAATLNSPDGRIKSTAAIVPVGAGGAISVFVTDATQLMLDINGYFVPASDPAALAFYPVTPCRIADTRGPAAPLGGPSIGAGETRVFPIRSSTCGIPSAAQAYSLNFAAVPRGPLGYLTAWPAGQSQPLVASLNASTGTVTANAVIVPAGTNGDVDVFATDATDLVIDVNGYFAPAASGGLSLYNLTPCRVLDSRLPPGALPLSGAHDIEVAGGSCGIPSGARAYVFSTTVVPPAGLGYLTLWPQGQSQPLVATLNASDGAITSNLAIVPTVNGSISAYPSHPTHLILDIFGYFSQ